jgi:putative ABC transport system substrate-binding protein
MQPAVADMLSSSPDVAIAVTNLALAVLKPVAGNVPVVFLGVGDPIGSGFVASLAHPGGNITGFG